MKLGRADALTRRDCLRRTAAGVMACHGMDLDDKQRAATRRALLPDAADRRVLLIGTHFPAPTAGLVARDGTAFRFEIPKYKRLVERKGPLGSTGHSRCASRAGAVHAFRHQRQRHAIRPLNFLERPICRGLLVVRLTV